MGRNSKLYRQHPVGVLTAYFIPLILMLLLVFAAHYTRSQLEVDPSIDYDNVAVNSVRLYQPVGKAGLLIDNDGSLILVEASLSTSIAVETMKESHDYFTFVN